MTIKKGGRAACQLVLIAGECAGVLCRCMFAHWQKHYNYNWTDECPCKFFMKYAQALTWEVPLPVLTKQRQLRVNKLCTITYTELRMLAWKCIIFLWTICECTTVGVQTWIIDGTHIWIWGWRRRRWFVGILLFPGFFFFLLSPGYTATLIQLSLISKQEVVLYESIKLTILGAGRLNTGTKSACWALHRPFGLSSFIRSRPVLPIVKSEQLNLAEQSGANDMSHLLKVASIMLISRLILISSTSRVPL